MAPKVAVVDDSVVALEWAQIRLEPFGYHVVTYNSSLGIQAFVSAQQPELLLLDVQMPALNGDMVCRMLKSNPRTQNVRVVLYSTLPDSELSGLADSVGADGYISKTDDVDQLAQRIRQLLDAAAS